MLTNSTVEEVIKIGKNKNINHANIHFKAGYVGEDGIRRIYNMASVVDLYRDILLSNMIEIELSDVEMVDYRFRPRSYCYDMYNDVELWSILLRLNNMNSSVDFVKHKFLSFGPKFKSILNEILTIEDDRLISSDISAKTK